MSQIDASQVPAEWVEAAADALDTWGTGHLRRDLPHALAAIIPLIREQAAKEIEGYAGVPGRDWREGTWNVIRECARIARGEA